MAKQEFQVWLKVTEETKQAAVWFWECGMRNCWPVGACLGPCESGAGPKLSGAARR